MNRSVPAAIASTLVVVLSVGVATAAGGSGKSVKACVNSKGVIGAATAKGKCAKGFHKVAIAKQGKPGKNGKNGKDGKPGAPGTDNVSALHYSASEDLTETWHDVGGTGLMTVQLECYMSGTSTIGQLRLVPSVDINGISTTTHLTGATPTGGFIINASSSGPSDPFALTAGALAGSDDSTTTFGISVGDAGIELSGVIGLQVDNGGDRPGCILNGTLTSSAAGG